MSRTKQMIYRAFCYCLSLALAVILAASFSLAFFAVLYNDGDYMSKFFTTGKITNGLYFVLDEQLEDIAKQEDIDKQVLTDAFSIALCTDAQNIASKVVRTGLPIDLRESTDVEKRLQNSFEKYESDNKIKISKDKKKAIMDKSIDAFSKTYTVANATQFTRFANILSGKSPMLVFAMLLAGIGCCVFLYFMNGRRKKVLNYMGMSFITAGEVMVILPVFSFLKKVHISLSLTNIGAYNAALMNSMKLVFCLIVAFGVIFILSGVTMFIASYRHYAVKYRSSDTDREIQKNLIF